MTVLSRGARPRRGGRRPGWLLLTALLVLAIAASSALVFTNRVELLKLAVILALWAAVVAAFVSVIYRRQSDVDQARARDMKMVYDLQLDREISARRDYELTVESQLRRELAAELRAQAADEVAALRSELSALRTTLEILFDADLGDRPALETERTTVRAYSDWAHPDENVSARREFGDRFTSVHAEDANSRTSENPIIDVPEVGVPPASGPLVAHRDAGEGAAEAFHTAEANADAYRGSHWRPSEVGTWPSPPRHDQAAQPDPRPQNTPEPLPPEPAPQFETRFAPPEPEPATSRDQPHPARHVRDWPVRPEEDSRPPATGGSDEVPAPDDNYSSPFAEPAEASPAPEPPLGRHYGTPGPAAVPPDPAVSDWRPARAGGSARHSTDSGVYDLAARPAPAPESTPTPAARHRTADEEPDTDGPQTGGQSVADLLARLQAGSTSGGRRRRRED